MHSSISFLLNDTSVSSGQPAGMVTLDYLRRERGLTGTREGCREGDCGACAVLLGEPAGEGMLYRVVNSCLLPLGAAAGRHLVTIEGLNPAGAGEPGRGLPALNPIQECFLEEGATQCGFCTPGFVVSLTGYLLRDPRPTLAGALDAVAGNICRCTGYASIRRAVARLLDRVGMQVPPVSGPERLKRLAEAGVIPPYCVEIPRRLGSLAASAGRATRAALATREPLEAGAAEARGGAPVLVAGGTDLFVQRPDELEHGSLRFLSGEPGLSGVWRENGRLVIGAATTVEELQALPELAATLAPAADALQWVASSPIRQRATVGGNLVNASPIGDLTVLLLALDARLGLRSPEGTRELPLESFYRGYKQLDLVEGEVVAWIAFGPPAADAVLSFEKVARRKHLDIASVNSAALLRADGAAGTGASPGIGVSRRILEARLAAGGVAPVPLFLARTSAYLVGKQVEPEVIRRALDTAQEEIAPIGDVRGSGAYKRLVLRQLLIAHFLRGFPEELAGEDWR